MKQISRILREVNYNLHQIKLVKCLAVHNEEDWIEYNLRNNYDEYDIIRVVEGAVRGRPGSTHDGHSTDRTLEIIRSSPDPDNKIELYTLDRHLKSLEEQKQIFLDVATDGEWLLIVDGDEFYMDGAVDRIRKAIHKYPLASEFIPTFLHFYRDFFHIRDYENDWNLWHQRIIRFRPGMRYYTHPVVTLADGRCSYFEPAIQPERYMIPIHIFHYGHVKSVEEHKKKSLFYSTELSKYEGEGGNASVEFNTKLDEFINRKEDLSKVLIYNDEHPQCLDEHPSRNKKDEDYHFLESSLIRKAVGLRYWKESEAFGGNLPTIPQWMKYQKRMQPFYNVCEV